MDLKNIDLKNINIADIKEKISAIDRKTWIKFGIGFGSIILFLIIYYAILNPIVKNKKALHQDKILKEKEIKEFEKSIITYKKKIKKLTPEFEKNSALFHSKAEVEGLYESLSLFADKNKLIISKISKKDPEPILKGGKKAKKKKGTIEKKNVSYYKIPVSYEINGNFLNYVKFKRDIAKSKKLLNFNKEVINIEKNSNGNIIATGELTIVGLPNEFN